MPRPRRGEVWVDALFGSFQFRRRSSKLVPSTKDGYFCRSRKNCLADSGVAEMV